MVVQTETRVLHGDDDHKVLSAFLLSLGVFFVLSLVESPKTAWTEWSLENGLAILGLTVIYFGAAVLGWSVVCFRNSSRQRRFEVIGSVMLLIGASLYGIALSEVIKPLINEGCLGPNPPSDVGCYYGFYYGAIVEFICIRLCAIAFMVLIRCFSFKVRLFLFGADVGATSMYLALFWIFWYLDQDSDEYLTFVKVIVSALILFVVLLYVGMFLCFCYRFGRMTKLKARILLFVFSLFIFVFGVLMFLGAFYADKEKLFDGYFKHERVFGYLVVGISFGVSCTMFVFTLLSIMWKGLKNDDERSIGSIERRDANVNGGYNRMMAIV